MWSKLQPDSGPFSGVFGGASVLRRIIGGPPSQGGPPPTLFHAGKVDQGVVKTFSGVLGGASVLRRFIGGPPPQAGPPQERKRHININFLAGDRGVSRLGGQGSKFYVLSSEPKEHNFFCPDTRPGGPVTGATG